MQAFCPYGNLAFSHGDKNGLVLTDPLLVPLLDEHRFILKDRSVFTQYVCTCPVYCCISVLAAKQCLRRWLQLVAPLAPLGLLTPNLSNISNRDSNTECPPLCACPFLLSLKPYTRGGNISCSGSKAGHQVSPTRGSTLVILPMRRSLKTTSLISSLPQL